MKNLETYLEKLGKRARKIYENTEDILLEPGNYEVTETDYGGMREESQFRLKLTKPINMKDLAVKLMEEKGYFSPWNDLRIRKELVTPESIYTI